MLEEVRGEIRTDLPPLTDKNPFGAEGVDFEEDLITHVDKEFDRRFRERQAFELQWRLNIAFIEGRQHAMINPVAAEIMDTPPLYWWQEREVFNHIAPIVETRMARLGRLRPVLKVRVPSPGGDEADQGAALVSTAILNMAYEDMRMPDQIAEALAWLESTGTVVFKYVWNPDAGRIIGYRMDLETSAAEGENGLRTQSRMGAEGENVIPADAANAFREMGMEIDGEPIHEGDMETVICPPQEIFPESSWQDGIRATRSIIHAKAYHIDTIKDNWGVEVAAEEMQVARIQRVTAGSGGIGFGADADAHSHAAVKLENHTLVKEYWEKPSKKYPEGRLIIVAGKKLLHAGPLPYKVGDDAKPSIPMERVQCIRRPGCFWGRSVVQRLIPLQRRYNALRNRKAEYLNRCAIGTVVYEEGSVDPDVLEQDAAAPGAVIPYRRGFGAPRFMDNPQLPQAFESEERTLLDELTIISGVSEIARQSKAPPGVKSGVALSIAIEQDDTRLSHTAENLKRALVESGKIWLRMFKQHVQAPRLLRQVGKQHLLPVTHWIGSDIKAENVVVEGVANLLDSLHQRRQMIFDLLNTELFRDPASGQITPHGRARIFEMLELGDWENYNDIEQLHIDRAERENATLIRGQLTEPAPYDEHILHLARHNRARVTVDYEETAARSPEVAQAFEAHIRLHMEALMQQLPPQQQPPQQQPPTVPGPAAAEEVPVPPLAEHPQVEPVLPMEAAPTEQAIAQGPPIGGPNLW